MANYISQCRTNYFRVTDEEKYQKIFSRLIGNETEIEDFTEEKDGDILHGFGSLSTVYYKTDESEEPDGNLEAFLQELQLILPHGEAFIFIECGHQKLNYISGHVSVVTKDNIRHLTLDNLALVLAREMLNDPEFTTRMEY